MATKATTTTVLSLNVVKENLDAALKAFETREREIKDKKVSLRAEIDEEFKSFVQILGDRKKQLLGRLESLTQHKLQCLTAHKQQVELTHTKMSNLIIETSTGDNQTRKEISVEFDPSTIQPQTEADVELVTNGREQVCKACRGFGGVYSEQVSIEGVSVSGNGLKYAKTGEQTSIEIRNMTEKLKLSAELVHTKSGAIVMCEVKQENGQHTITYQPTTRGKHSLNIRINEKHIQGSPYPIAVTPSLQSLRKPVRVVGGLNRPRGTITNSRGNLIVAEYESHCISIFTSDGKKRSFGKQGSENGQLNKPRDVAVDKNDNIYVADMGNHRIQKFTPEGKFIATVGSQGSNNTQFNLPLGICFNKRKDRLFVCDQGNYRIQVLSTNLAFKRTFGSEGIELGQFNFPENVAVDDANNIYVTDYWNNRVQVFTTDGQFLRAITHKAITELSATPQVSTSDDKLKHPRAVAVDSCNTVYVSEWDRDCVSLFTPQGDFITSFGSKGREEGQFNRVYGITVDENDSIIVSENSRLQVF